MAWKISSARYGWVLRAERGKAGKIINVYWTKHREGARPFKQGDRDLADIHEALYSMGIMHDMVQEYVPWVDDGKE